MEARDVPAIAARILGASLESRSAVAHANDTDPDILWVDANDSLGPQLVDRQHVDVGARKGESKHVREGILE